MQNNTPQLVLASGSPYRLTQISQQLGLQVSAIAPQIDETPLINEHPRDCAARLSESKALAVSAQLTIPAIVIASDQTAEFKGAPLKKPGDRATAIQQLSHFSDQTVTFYSGLFVMDNRRQTQRIRVVTTEVKFKKLRQEQIEYYVDYDRPFDCVGAFKNESLGIALFESITSNDPSALTGLPLISLSEFLWDLGIDVLNQQEN